MAGPGAWQLILPVKGGPTAKSRLRGPDPARADLAMAMALDCLEAVLATQRVAGATVVTGDAATAAAARALGAQARRPAHPDGGLGPAVLDGIAGVEAGPVAVLLADVPALRPADLEEALRAVEAALAEVPAAFVPDAEGTGTVLLAAFSAADLVPAFGPASARAHARLGARRLDLDLPRLRRDVDTPAALAAALALGVGPRTLGTLGGMQATVLTFDPATRRGSVVTDDGLRLAMPAVALAGSGLRHLRPGQRVTCRRDGQRVLDVRITGISD